jgi:hypothetical protein
VDVPASAPVPPDPSGTGPPPRARLRTETLAVADEAIGRGSRADPVLGATGGPAGNARLTAWTGLVLLALVVAELVTLLDVRGLLSWHVVIGVLLVPFALLKTASTGWRIVRYYTGTRPYRSAGPPPLFLRVLGPLVIATTLGVLGSGIWLIAVGEGSGRSTLFSALGRRIDLLTVHQALFIAFAVVTGLHLLARIVPALTLVSSRVRAGLGARTPAGVPGGGRRVTALAATLVAAAVAAALLLPLADSWRGDEGHGQFRPPPAGFAVHP